MVTSMRPVLRARSPAWARDGARDGCLGDSGAGPGPAGFALRDSGRVRCGAEGDGTEVDRGGRVVGHGVKDGAGAGQA